VRRILLLVAVLAPFLLAGCLDPRTGTPPPVGASGVPAYRGTVSTVTAADLGSSWRSGCPIGPSQLRRVRVDYWGFDGAVHRGDLIIRATEAQHVAQAFHQLYDARFMIDRIHPVQRYGSDDDASMAANNTSAFNCRRVTGGTSWSEHSYGTAIDINPVQNPYVTRSGTVLPPAGRPYADRSVKVAGTINRNGIVRSAFAQIGWEWGGDWTNPKDYQHLTLNDR
jgi:hypothetical protein